MQTEERWKEEGTSVIIESQDVGQVTLVDGDAVPVDCFVAAEDIAETVIGSTDTEVAACADISEVVVSPCIDNRTVSNIHSVTESRSTRSPVGTYSDAMVVQDAQAEPSKSVSSVGSGPTGARKEDSQVVEVKVIPIEMLYDGTLWSQFDFTKTGDEEMFVSESDSVPLTVSDGVTDVARQVEVTTRSDNMCLSIRDITKREKDRQKKRVLRANPLFREKEKQKAKERMQTRRQDPSYREQERQRDRERRQLARRRNHTLRERERERDKVYKKHYRSWNRTANCEATAVTDPCKSLDSFPCQVYLNTQYNTESS